MIIHHLHHGSRKTLSVIPTIITPDDMRHAASFHEFGTFPIPAIRSSTDERHTYLSSLTGAADAAGQQGLEGDRALIRTIVARLKTEEPVSVSQEEAEMNPYSVEIAMRVEDVLATSNGDEVM